MKKVEIELFSLEDLGKEVQKEVIQSQKEFLIDVYQDDDFDSSFNMTRSKYANSITIAEIKENIEINGYLYFFDGSMASTISYCGKHKRSGENVLTLYGKEYLI